MEKLRLKTKLMYSSGDLSVAATMSMVSFFQLFFLTDVAGLSPSLAGWALLAGKLWDALNDPLAGVLADRISHPFGRRRVLILWGAVPMALGYYLMWLVPPWPQAVLAVYYALAIIVFDSAYTLVHIGYNALTPSLTRDYDERSSLNGIRMAYQIGGSMGAIVIFTLLGWKTADQTVLYERMGLVLGLIALVPLILVLLSTESYRETKAGSLRVKTSLRATLTNRPFRRFIGLYLLSWTTASMMSAVLVYFTRYYLEVPGHSNYIVLTAQGAALALIPLVVRLCRKREKKTAFILGSLAWIGSMMGISLLPAGALAATYVLAASCGWGIATAYVVPWAMLPDIIEFDQALTGQRREGAFYSFSAFFQKLGTALALWLMGQVMDLMGYVSSTGSEAVGQSPSAIRAIRLFMGPVPAFLLLGAIFFCFRYPINRENHRERLLSLGKKAPIAES